MADELLVSAGWAIWGKPPGTRQDYSVLDCSSTPFTRADFGTIITRFATGNPDTTATGPGALPWVTVSWVGVDTALHLGIAITSQTGLMDGVGRPITQTAYFCVPYEQVASAAQARKAVVNYAALHEAARQVTDFPADGGTIPLALRLRTAAEAASLVQEAGEQAVRAAAALLLSGPVSVVQAHGSTPEERLAFIDAVASLLPYGFRAKFSAATWSDSGTKHRVRLAFAARPREDAATVTWRHPQDAAAGGDVARHYHAQLCGLLDRRSALGSGPALPAVIMGLAADVEPRRFEQPEPAIASLRRIDLPYRILRAVLDGARVDLAEFREVFRFDRLAELETETQVVTLLEALASAGDADDWPALSRWLAGVRETGSRLRVLAIFGRRMLWSACPDMGVVGDCLRVAAEDGSGDCLLAELVRPPEAPAGEPAGVEAVTDLVARTVLADDTGPDPYPATRDLLVSTPAGAEYLAAFARTGGPAESFLRWLSPPEPSAVRRLFAVAFGAEDGDVTPADIGQLAAAGVAWVRALLQAASSTRRLEWVLPAFTEWLTARGELDPDERAYWGDQLAALAAWTPQLQAWLDTALLSIGAAPSALPPADQPAGERYSAALAEILAVLGQQYSPFSVQECIGTLAVYLAGPPWTATRQQALAVTQLADRLRRFDPKRVLDEVVASALAAAPDARRWDFAANWLAWWAEDNDPDVLRQRLTAQFAGAPPGADPGHLAGLCAQAWRQGSSPDDAFTLLAGSGAVNDAVQAEQVLVALREEFARFQAGNETTEKWQLRLAELLAHGEFGADLAYDLRELISVDSLHDISFNLQLLAIFASGGRERQYEWTESERDELDRVGSTIESMLRKSRRNPLWRGRNTDGEAEQGSMPGA